MLITDQSPDALLGAREFVSSFGVQRRACTSSTPCASCRGKRGGACCFRRTHARAYIPLPSLPERSPRSRGVCFLGWLPAQDGPGLRRPGCGTGGQGRVHPGSARRVADKRGGAPERLGRSRGPEHTRGSWGDWSRVPSRRTGRHFRQSHAHEMTNQLVAWRQRPPPADFRRSSAAICFSTARRMYEERERSTDFAARSNRSEKSSGALKEMGGIGLRFGIARRLRRSPRQFQVVFSTTAQFLRLYMTIKGLARRYSVVLPCTMTTKAKRPDAVSIRFDDQELGYLASLQASSGLDRTGLVRMILRFAFHEWAAGRDIFPRTRVRTPDGPAPAPAAQHQPNITISHSADSHKKKRKR